MLMELPLKPIKVKRISDQVFEQLRELIFRSQLKPGDQLMPERDLSTALGVSRTSVRNAISKLVVLGYLEQQQGQGTFVCGPDSLERNPLAVAMGVQEGTLADLLEVRMGLECNAAILAAERAVERDIDALKSSLEKMKAEVKSGRLGTNEDVSFHMAIAFATKNPVQVHLMRTFYDLLFVGIERNLLHLYEEADRLEEIITQHTEIVHAIRNHDPEMAYRTMKDHILYVMNYLKSYQGELADY